MNLVRLFRVQLCGYVHAHAHGLYSVGHDVFLVPSSLVVVLTGLQPLRYSRDLHLFH